VAGFADPNSTTGPGTGVFGQGASGGPGVRGIGSGGTNDDPSNAAGVYGRGGAGNADGVQGRASGTFSGVAGFGVDEFSIGVFGQGGTGNSDGVQGHGSGAFSGVAGYADPNSTTGPGTGVWGLGASGGPGVRGIGSGGPNTSAPAGNAVGVLGQGGTGNSDGVLGIGSGKGAGVLGVARSGPSGVGHAGLFDGDVTVNGRFVVNGTKSAAVPFPDGSHRLLYALESPECWFEDFGTAVMVDGEAQVRLDPDFAATVDTGDYHVFLTEYDDNNGLYM
jgi:hypothetical protein